MAAFEVATLVLGDVIFFVIFVFFWCMWGGVRRRRRRKEGKGGTYGELVLILVFALASLLADDVDSFLIGLDAGVVFWWFMGLRQRGRVQQIKRGEGGRRGNGRKSEKDFSAQSDPKTRRGGGTRTWAFFWLTSNSVVDHYGELSA